MDFEILRGNYENSSGHKKLNKSLICHTHPLVTLSDRASPSIIDKRLCNYVALIQNNVIRMENDVTARACPTDYCGFPYYRTNKSFRDNVLMKDVAVSCNLSERKAFEVNVTLSAIENYFRKHFKNEYQDLSVITKKISAYTKDKLHNLSSRYKRRSNFYSEQQPVATEYIDRNGNICLKLRLKDVPSNVSKEESTVKSIVSAFLHSWNFLSSLQRKTENIRGNILNETIALKISNCRRIWRYFLPDEKKKFFMKHSQQSCVYVHKDKYRKDQKILLLNENTPKVKMIPGIRTVSYTHAQKRNKYHNRKM